MPLPANISDLSMGDLDSPKFTSISRIDREDYIASFAFPVHNKEIATRSDTFEFALGQIQGSHIRYPARRHCRWLRCRPELRRLPHHSENERYDSKQQERGHDRDAYFEDSHMPGREDTSLKRT